LLCEGGQDEVPNPTFATVGNQVLVSDCTAP